jgi:AraC-like DNA-binding protein
VHAAANPDKLQYYSRRKYISAYSLRLVDDPVLTREITVQNRVKVWRMADMHDAELLKGDYRHHAYPWHSHAEISLGLVVGGAIKLQTRSREGVASAGSFVLINAEEVHQGSPSAAEGWSCRTIHVHPSVIKGIAAELRSFTSVPTLAFRSPTFEDPELARRFLGLHQFCETTGSSLEKQSVLMMLIARLLARHAETPVRMRADAGEPIAVRRARSYLDSNLSDKVTLGELAAAADLTPFRLLRAFQGSIGITPHAYQMQTRVRMAHGMIRQKAPLADVAAATGFADQAHLTRVFKRIMGATPGQFRAAALAA